MQKLQDPLVRLIAALPFLAGCSHPERLSAIHTNAYFMMSKKGLMKQLFLHDEEDDKDFFSRLLPLNFFIDGNCRIIERGMNILLLVMIQDYIEDSFDDKLKEKYNPVNNGVWRAAQMRMDLIEKIQLVDCPEMESIFPLNIAKTRGFWYL